jgi:hypothetical protein
VILNEGSGTVNVKNIFLNIKASVKNDENPYGVPI